jgi:hypothetical protein
MYLKMSKGAVCQNAPWSSPEDSWRILEQRLKCFCDSCQRLRGSEGIWRIYQINMEARWTQFPTMSLKVFI